MLLPKCPRPPVGELRKAAVAPTRATQRLHRARKPARSHLIRLITRPSRGVVTFRQWVRRAEIGIVGLALLSGAAAGLMAVLMSEATQHLHAGLFGADSLSLLKNADPLTLLAVPALGGLLLGLLNWVLARRGVRTPIDPIEANALHGGRMRLSDGVVVAAQNIVSNGFGASVGLEAAFAQVGSSLASRLGGAFGLRRGDLRMLVGCGAAGALSAAFCAPVTGAFYAFELVVSTYSIASLAPVMASAVAGMLVASMLGRTTVLSSAGSVAAPSFGDYPLALLLGLLCGFLAIALMKGMTLVEAVLRRAVPWGWLRPMAGGLAVGALALLSTGVLSAGHGILHLALATNLAVPLLLGLLILKTAGTAISIGSGFRGGLFFASLLLGALLGKLFAVVGTDLLPIPVDPMLFAVIGTSAFGAAVVGAPLALTFLALEGTRDFAVAGPVLVAVIAATMAVRRLFGYSFATWRFHLRGETIRSAHDIGWLRDLTVGRLMRRDVTTLPLGASLAMVRRAYPLGSTQRLIVIDETNRYAGLLLLPEVHAAGPDVETINPLLRLRQRALLPAMNAKEAMALFEDAEAEALAVVDGVQSLRVIGMLTEAHLLRRYGEEVDKRRRDEVGIP
ncbi:chloride channel protein [Azospirillum melinis]